jgi:prepilin-type processing-associated H-X9-DG protein
LVGEYATQPATINRAVYWGYSYFGMNLGSVVDNVGSFFLVPDYRQCSLNQPDPGFPQACRRAFASNHGGGASINFAYCDGSVHAITTDVNLTVLAGMATINGGETTVWTE